MESLREAAARSKFTPLFKPFKTREQVEKAREKLPERLRKKIGLGVIRRQN